MTTNNRLGQTTRTATAAMSEVSLAQSHQPSGFDWAMGVIIPRYIKFLRSVGVREAGKYYKIDYRRKTLILGFPLRKGLIYPVLIHISTRKHYTPASKVCNQEKETGHFYSACRALFNYSKKKGHYLRMRFIRDRSIFLVCNSYTKSVRGVIRKSYSGISVAAIVIKRFGELQNGLKTVWNWVYNYISARLSRLREALKRKHVKAFGDVATFEKNLSLLLDFVSLISL